MRSHFGLNLFLQLVLATIFGVLTGFTYSASDSQILPQLLGSIGWIFGLSFWFGVVYAVFRLFGARGGVLEAYYQNFPLSGGGVQRAAAPPPKADTTAASPPASGFNWDELFSPRYLRYAGMLLVLSAIFSVLFRIDWQLLQKIAASFLLAAAGFAAAEYAHRRGKAGLSAPAYLIGFAALQFGFTLGSKYCALNHSPDPAQLSAVLLGLKFVAALALLRPLTRYGGASSSAIYFAIVYLGPLSVMQAGLTLSFTTGAVFVLALSTLVLVVAAGKDRVELAVLNAVAANIILILLLGAWQRPGDLAATAPLAFSCFLVIFIGHLIAIVALELSGARTRRGLDVFHTAAAHAFVVIGTSWTSQYIPKLTGQFGLLLLALSLLPMLAHFYIQSRRAGQSSTAGLLQMAILLSACGLFLEAKGPWTAVVFLLYACLILWYSLVRHERSMRLFAFVILTASLFKLYFESSELFDSISGSTVILVLGVVLLLLGNKMEQIKGLLKGGEKK